MMIAGKAKSSFACKNCSVLLRRRQFGIEDDLAAAELKFLFPAGADFQNPGGYAFSAVKGGKFT